MIANANSSPAIMKRALAYTITAFKVASKHDLERTDEDREFFAAKKAPVEQIFDQITEAKLALETHNLRDGLEMQLQVTLCDAMLDRKLSKGKTLIKLMLGAKLPDSANFVFGNDIKKLIRAEMKAQPYLVLECLTRLATLPDFEGKNKLVAELEKLANQQIANLQQRALIQVKRADLLAKLNAIIGEAAKCLYQLNHELLMRFPGEQDYINEFFLNITKKKKKNDDEPEAEPEAEPTK